MKEVTLLPAELAYLFALVGAKRAMGVEDAWLFPDDERPRKEVYQQGYASLVAHELITKHPKRGKDTLDRDLILFVDAIAHPKYVIETEIRDGQSADPKRMMHYVGRKVIVEQAYLGQEGFQIADLETLDAGVLRVARAADLPKKSRLGDHAVTLPAPVFKELRDASERGAWAEALARLTSFGLSEQVSKAALLSIGSPERSGTIRVHELDEGQVAGLRVVAYFLGEGGGWAVTKGHGDAELTLRTINAAQLWGVVATLLGQQMDAEQDELVGK